MRRRGLLILLCCLAICAPFPQAGYADGVTPPFTTDGPAPTTPPPGFATTSTPVAVMLRLEQPAPTTTRAQAQASIQASQSRVGAALRQRGIHELFRTRSVYNGIAVMALPQDLAALRALPGVADAQMITPKSQPEQEISSAISASLTQAAPQGATGAQVRIGVIDSGIDYTHATFGGAGTPAAYSSNDRTIIEPGSFPTAKVPGGYDFAGDSYNASNNSNATPLPDADPLDCMGRGTHIAGLIAGQGVTENGTVKLAAGIAPQASLYALKVFGCDPQATTALTTQALDWALDPNGDGDTSDHLDAVIIASSTPFGSANDPDAQAVESAVQAGMLVIAAAGDGNGSFYSVNAFGSATSALSVGASTGSPAPITMAAEEEYTDPACFQSTDLRTMFDSDSMATITNRSQTCTYQVGMASYRKFDEVIDHQEIFDSVTATIAPGQSLTLQVKIPDCAAQIDTFRGPVLFSLDGRRYDSRLIAARHIQGTNYCEVDTAPVYGIPASASRGIQPSNGTLKPDLVAPSINIRSAAVGGGTSSVEHSASWVGAAQVAGAVALLRSAHKDWTPAQIKAVLMNTASPVLTDDDTVYPPSLAGAGQLNLSRILTNNLIATVDDGLGSISYGAPIISQQWYDKHSIRISNPTSTPLTVSLNALNAATEPGVTLGLPTGTTIIPAGGSYTPSITMSIDPSQLDDSPDAFTPITVDTGTGGIRSRYFLAEHSGYIEINTSNSEPVRVPFVVVPRSASDASTDASLALGSDSTSFTLNIANTGARNASMVNNTNNTQLALVSAFELLGSSPAQNVPAYASSADLRYFGLTSNLASATSGRPSVLYVGFSTAGAWSTPNEVQFRLLIDTNLDNIADAALVSMSWPDAQGKPSDVFRFALYKLEADGSLGAYLGEGPWNTLAPSSGSPYVDVAPFNSQVALAAFGLTALGLPSNQNVLQVKLESRARDASGYMVPVDQIPASGWIRYDITRPAIAPLARRGAFANRPLFVDSAENVVSGAVLGSVIAARGGTTMLVLHHHNAIGRQAALVDVRSTSLVPQSPNGPATKLYLPIAGGQ